MVVNEEARVKEARYTKDEWDTINRISNKINNKADKIGRAHV